MSDYSSTSIPTLTYGGNANFTAAFGTLAAAIEDDVSNLTTSGYTVLKPVVFVLTAAGPSNHVRSLKLTTFTGCPQIFVVSAEGADGGALQGFAHGDGRALVAKPGMSAAHISSELFRLLYTHYCAASPNQRAAEADFYLEGSIDATVFDVY